MSFYKRQVRILNVNVFHLRGPKLGRKGTLRFISVRDLKTRSEANEVNERVTKSNEFVKENCSIKS